MRPSLFITLLALVSFAFVSSSSAQEIPSFEKAAEKIQAATVTVRIGPAAAAEDSAEDTQTNPQVIVLTGVSLGDGLIVTPLFVASGARIRITVPGGEQAEALPLVLDEHSGLALLKMNETSVPGLALADSLPKVGSWVLTAAAWGVEKPVVSFGIVSGVERMLPGGNYPPLLACDLRTADTSSGSGVVNVKGELVGIVVAADGPVDHRGWTYAVPVKHVQRLLRSRPDSADKGSPESNVVVLKRRRPIVGMVLDGQKEKIVVSRVVKESPAERAGIKTGDEILAADGIKIRSVYQAVTPTIYKQPGDTVTFEVKHGDEIRSVEVVLGGGVVVPGVQLGQYFEPKVTVDGSLVKGDQPAATIGEVAADGATEEANARDPQKLLEEAIRRYLSVIEIQKAQLLRLERERSETSVQIEALKAENEALKRQLEAEAKPSKP